MKRTLADNPPVDPPFYQKQSDSSNEGVTNRRETTALPFAASTYEQLRHALPTQSSSAGDYRSVIDDLTVENKRLKEELKRYKQFGPDLLRKDKLFEIKVHGLPRKKKRELEATLRDFASSLEGSVTSSHQRKKPSKHLGRPQGTSLNSKHASSSSSHSRPVDSAYASMSTGPSSVGPNASSISLGRPSMARGRSSTDQKVERYLEDIPEGLFPRQVAMTDKEKKKLVVRRLEQLFTGKMMSKGRGLRSIPQAHSQPGYGGIITAPTQLLAPSGGEPSREARIQFELAKKESSGEDLSVTNSNGENDTAGNQTRSGSGSNEHSGQDNSPQTADLPEQRATRPVDLDPDRVQNPSENMQYIRHLGVTAPRYVNETKYRPQDVSMDADGWIHLNLLCNLAQLHILNVTPDYIRSAVTERSTKFQLSRDGRKIRWRGGTEGTKFSSDSSGGSSQRSHDTEGTDGSNEDGQRKKPKMGGRASAHSSKSQTKLDPQASASSDSFHYKPMFVRNQASSLGTSMDETASQASFVPEQSNQNSRSFEYVSGSGSSPHKKRRRDGAIIYYTGAPFCLDLSGDPSGDVSPTTYLTSSGQEHTALQAQTQLEKPELVRSASGSSLPHRPLVDGPEYMETEESEFVGDETDMSDDEDFAFPWCEAPDKPELRPLQVSLEPCGLGGVTPEDHFAILVVTRHPLGMGVNSRPGVLRLMSDETTDSIASRIAGLSTDSPCPPGSLKNAHVQIQVIMEKYKELKPLPLPPPAIFYPPFTETTESEDSGFEDDYVDDDESDIDMENLDEDISKCATRESENEFAQFGGLESDGDDDEIVSDELDQRPRVSFGPIAQRVAGSSIDNVADMHPDSSGATAGGEASGYSSSQEESG